jgi:hypothetical protein
MGATCSDRQDPTCCSTLTCCPGFTCGFVYESGIPRGTGCCIAAGDSCGSDAQCCRGTSAANAGGAQCHNGRCCMSTGAGCTKDIECCAGSSCKSGFCAY